MDHVQNAGDSGRQKSRPPRQRCREDQSDADEEVFHDTSESQSVYTQTWDADSPHEANGNAGSLGLTVYYKLRRILEEFYRKFIIKISTLQVVVGSERENDELLKLVKQCLEVTRDSGRRAKSSTERSGEPKTLLESLFSTTQKHLGSAKKTADEEPDHVSTVQARVVVTLLKDTKTDMRCQADPTVDETSLRESIAMLQERLKACEATIVDIKSQAVVYQSGETSLEKRTTQHEASNASLRNECSSSEDLQARLEQAHFTHLVMRQEIEKMKAEEVTHAFKLGSLTTKVEESRQEKDYLQQRLIEMEHLLAEARRIVPNFEPEREQLRETAARDLKEYKLTVSKQAQANYSKHSGEMRQAQKLKEVAEKRLAIVEASKKEVENRLEEVEGRACRVESASREQAERHETELLGLRCTLQKSPDAHARVRQNHHDVVVQTEGTRAQRDSTPPSNRPLGSISTNQNLARLDEPQQKQNLGVQAGGSLRKPTTKQRQGSKLLTSDGSDTYRLPDNSAGDHSKKRPRADIDISTRLSKRTVF